MATVVNARCIEALSHGRRPWKWLTGIYRITRDYPRDELYGLISQLRRAAVSVPSNLAEEYGRNSQNEFHQFVGVARGSSAEIETQIEIARNLHHVSEESFSELLSRVDEVGLVLTGLRQWSKRSS